MDFFNPTQPLNLKKIPDFLTLQEGPLELTSGRGGGVF